MASSEIPESAAGQRKQFAAAYGILESAIREKAFPGAALGVLHRVKVLALDGVGRFTYDQDFPGETPGEVTPSTVYDLASVTKVVATTALAMMLYDRGVLDLEEPVGDILPGFVVGMEPGSAKNHVTLRMLLAHSSGLPAHARLYELHPTPQQMLRACLRLPLEAPPGTRVEYSDIGFILLGTAIEVLSGQKLASLCTREIFEPLGMTMTRFCPTAGWRGAIPPTEYETQFRKRVVQGEVHDENCFALGGATGHAGLFSNAADVLRFAGCILAGGRTPPGQPSLEETPDGRAPRSAIPESQLFQHRTVDLFATRQPGPPTGSRALGWDTPSGESSAGSLFSPNSIGHLGYTGASLWIDRERELAVVLLTNRTWPDPARSAASKEVMRRIRSLIHDAIFQAV